MVVMISGQFNDGGSGVCVCVCVHSLKKSNFYGQIPATLMPVVDRNNYG